MKRLLPIFFAALLIAVSFPVISYAGEKAPETLSLTDAFENLLNKQEASQEPDESAPDFRLGDMISQFITQNYDSKTTAETVKEPEAVEAPVVPEAVEAPETAAAPAADTTEAPEAAAAPVAEEGTTDAADPEEEPEPLFDEEKASEVLDALDNETYTVTMTSLMEGKTVNYGDYTYNAAGLQQLLVDLGCPISVDGSAGANTFKAVNAILTLIGEEETYTVDAETYWTFLSLALINTDADTADEILPKYYETEESGSQYEYMKAALLFAQERYYRAMEAYEESQYGDWEEKVALCQQPWPDNGELWHNSSYYSQQMSLSFKVNSYDEKEGKCFEVYAENGDLVSVLFLTGSGTVTTWLPGGAYRIKNASGTEWYGYKDAFGRYGYYEYMEFDEDESDSYLTWLYAGYEWTITVNVLEPDPSTTNVGSVYYDWENWTD